MRIALYREWGLQKSWGGVAGVGWGVGTGASSFSLFGLLRLEFEFKWWPCALRCFKLSYDHWPAIEEFRNVDVGVFGFEWGTF